MWLLDIVDNLLGPLNGVGRLDNLISGLFYRDMGHEFAVLYQDRGGHHSREEIERLLARYGIVCFARLHDAEHMYFRVKNRQADWAEYLLLHAGVAITSAPVNPRNQDHAASHELGWLPKPWRDDQ